MAPAAGSRIELHGPMTMGSKSLEHYHQYYWKVPSPASLTIAQMKATLSRRGYATPASPSAQWLRESLIRCELGQMSYVACTNDELRGFVVARDIGTESLIASGNKGTRCELLTLLDRADQFPSFDKFILLPPEIRNRVYAFYFEGFSATPLRAPVQPPITITSSQVRTETLQMFYDSCQFEIAMVENWMRPPMIGIRAKPNALRIPQKTMLWFHCLSPRNKLAIRRLRFDILSWEFTHRNRRRAYASALTWFELDIRRDEAEGKEKLQVFFPFGPNAGVLHLSKMRRAVVHLVGNINSRPARDGKVRLRGEDLQLFRSAMEA